MTDNSISLLLQLPFGWYDLHFHQEEAALYKDQENRLWSQATSSSIWLYHLLNPMILVRSLKLSVPESPFYNMGMMRVAISEDHADEVG